VAGSLEGEVAECLTNSYFQTFLTEGKGTRIKDKFWILNDKVIFLRFTYKAKVGKCSQRQKNKWDISNGIIAFTLFSRLVKKLNKLTSWNPSYFENTNLPEGFAYRRAHPQSRCWSCILHNHHLEGDKSLCYRTQEALQIISPLNLWKLDDIIQIIFSCCSFKEVLRRENQGLKIYPVDGF
jgi:hypothetical protein